MKPSKQIIQTDEAPVPRGPYSQAARYGNLLFVAGQVPVDPEGKPVGAGDVAAQTRQCLENLGAILKAAGSSFDCVLKTSVYLQDMADWPAMNEVYAGYFRKDPPARAAVQSDFSGLKNHWRVEIEAVAYIP